MSEPLVCAIMLVNGREAMVRRAVASFLAQSYERKHLLIYDSGRPPLKPHVGIYSLESWLYVAHILGIGGHTIGALRNQAIAKTVSSSGIVPDVICHFDSDDWSHPQRITEQVALLKASGADACGYHEAPFWDTRPRTHQQQADRSLRKYMPGDVVGETWLFRDPARKHVLGASMAYWRKTWERRPFDDINRGEDERFQSRCNTKAVSGLYEQVWAECDLPPALGQTKGYSFRGHVSNTVKCEPRIVCGIHGGNTSNGYDFTKRQQCFKRAVEFDEYCARVMRLGE